MSASNRTPGLARTRRRRLPRRTLATRPNPDTGLSARTAARWTLGTLAAVELGASWWRWSTRAQLYELAAARARATGRRLVVVGAPGAGLHTRLFPAYGCGDVCVDLNGCASCAGGGITADITQGPVAGVADNTAVVFVACVLEYVSDPARAVDEIERMAGSTENVFIATVQGWTATAALYPGARQTVDPAAPYATRPVSTTRKVVTVGALAGLAAVAFWPEAT